MSQHREHWYPVEVRWSGNLGQGTSGYRSFSRNHELIASGKAPILGSADPAFRGDQERYNPEELLVFSVAACHMLWYLHLCAGEKVVVLEYRDSATGTMIEDANGSGRFIEILLKPHVLVAPGSDLERCERIHADAHRMCFIANSVNFPIRCQPALQLAGQEKKE